MSIFKQFGLPSVINASGRMTKLGVSCIGDEVGESLLEAAKSYVVIDDLYKEAGNKIATMIGANDVCVTSSASSGIALSIASLLCGSDISKVHRFQETVNNSLKKEVIMLRGQNVNFGAPIDSMIEIGGGKVVEVGYANQSSIEDITQAISKERTLAIIFIKSHHCVQKNMVDAKAAIAAANENNIPIIVDAAAEENLSMYMEMGADFVCYSGAKAISGPTSGFVACRNTKDADNMRLQYKGIGRVMKVGKENIVGLVKAVEIYQKNGGYIPTVNYEQLLTFNNEVNEIKGLQAEIIKDEAGRKIYRSKITVDENIYGLSALALVEKLVQNNPQIYTRDYQANVGSISIDPRPLRGKEELDIIRTVLEKIRK
ncbi:MAG: DgaE family pyridoxal phosphate-dependent ammonia lyase [Breznakia sp.]